jgi:hypothetical protein
MVSRKAWRGLARAAQKKNGASAAFFFPRDPFCNGGLANQRTEKRQHGKTQQGMGYIPPHLRQQQGAGAAPGGGSRSLADLESCNTGMGNMSMGGGGGFGGGGYQNGGGGGYGGGQQGGGGFGGGFGGGGGQGGYGGGGYGGGGGGGRDMSGFGVAPMGGGRSMGGGGRMGGGGNQWFGVDGGDDFEANLEGDEQAYRREFGEPASSGIDFGKYADIPVELELPQGVPALPEAAYPVKQFADLNCGRLLLRNLRMAGFVVPTPVQGNSVPMAISGMHAVSNPAPEPERLARSPYPLAP